MPIKAQLGVVREVGAELQEERSEVAVQAVDVEVVHHRGGPHQPRISDTVLFITAPLGAENRRLLLRFPDEYHSLGFLELLSLLCCDGIFALTLVELYDWDLLSPRKLLQRCYEFLADRVHQSAGGELVAAVKSKEPGYTLFPLQTWNVTV